MKIQESGNYVVYNNKPYIYRIHETFITIYGDETDHFNKFVNDHTIVDGEKVYNKKPIITFRKNITFSDVLSAYDLHYEADYQGERFLALVGPNNPKITLHTGDEAIARKFGLEITAKASG